MTKAMNDKRDKLANGMVGSIRSPHEHDLFCQGWDAAIKEMQAEVDKYKELHSIWIDHWNNMKKERDSLKSQAEKYQTDVDWYEAASRIAIDALKEIKNSATKGDETTTELECFYIAEDALNKINQPNNDQTSDSSLKD